MTGIEILLIILMVAMLMAMIWFAFLLKRKFADAANVVGPAVDSDAVERLQRLISTESERDRETQQVSSKELRSEVRESLEGTQRVMSDMVEKLGNAQRGGLDQLSKNTHQLLSDTQKRLAELDQAIAQRLQALQEGNEKKLEEMRLTVDEKLQATLQARLSESFKMVTAQLTEVQKGLGEMRNLAENVGDLQRVLSTVKSRGLWGEVQLGAILEDVLTPDQYASNVETIPGTGNRVEFAVRMPGVGDGRHIWMPIDSKFPQEDWMRLQAAAESGDAKAQQQATAGLRRAVSLAASDIREKYVGAPHTIDYGIMFLPTEGLYGEVLRIPGLDDELRTKHRVVPAGPTTLAALLSSVRLGFRAMAIKQRSAEIWDTLAAVKDEFEKFEGVIDKLKRQLETAQNTVSEMGTRSRAMKRKMIDVEELPEGTSSAQVLGLPESEAEANSDASSQRVLDGIDESQD